MEDKKRATILMLAGTLPFLVGAFFLWIDFLPGFLPAGIRQIVHSYAVIVICIISGIHWGIQLKTPTSMPLFIIGAVSTLTAWLSLAVSGTFIGLLVVSATLFILLGVDWKIYREKLIPSWFFTVKCIASVIVIFCLVLMILD